MKIATLILNILAVILIIFNATKLDFNALLTGESFSAVLSIIAGLCAIILLQTLRLSKKIEALQKKRK
ncbi:hypothetical protein [Winogradskyella aurantia]|uniref:Uncharacterized protein n=1 Tax=Winogradskyella aurantia TaxID=1915063 RepID=A0A265V0F5_9FLAO|nr:hypothetical protein [Winogradskyella aurantia]OZV71041.1 hypothetical protein CA834_02705 [Winogradskyella aurantia]